METIGALAALVISVLTFASMQIALLRTANRDAVEKGQKLLEVQLGDCIKARDEFARKVTFLENEVGQLRGENYRMMERVLRLERNGT